MRIVVPSKAGSSKELTALSRPIFCMMVLAISGRLRRSASQRTGAPKFLKNDICKVRNCSLHTYYIPILLQPIKVVSNLVD